METCSYSVVHTPIGALTVVCSDRGLTQILFGEHHVPTPNTTWQYSEAATKECTEELRSYFAGELRAFTVPLDLRGTEFQLKCWNALLRIPYGSTRTYANLAGEIGNPSACRAVGAANGANPIPIVVPCHRVLATGGKLGGYGGGLGVKEALLRLEGAWPLDGRGLFGDL